jgi:hypothetical protein
MRPAGQQVKGDTDLKQNHAKTLIRRTAAVPAGPTR